MLFFLRPLKKVLFNKSTLNHEHTCAHKLMQIDFALKMSVKYYC